MTITCDKLDDLLLEGDAHSVEVAARHARGCAECAARLADWNDIGETARALQTDWRSDMLWPRIERAIKAGKRSRSIRTTWQVAAAAVLTIGISAGSWLAIQHSRNAAFDREILRVSALDDVEKAEKAHVDAINRLEKVTDATLEDAKTPLMVAYKEKLMLLDDAIAECQTNIDRNRQNAHLRKQLLAIYSEKQRTLEQVMREGNHASNQ